MGDLPPELMPQWAALALTRGYDSPTLRELAGAADEPRTLRDLFTTALDELGAPALDDRQALWVMAHTYARCIVDGLMSPEEGAELIWGLSSALETPDELDGMLDEATDLDYARDVDREEIRRGILAEAHELLTRLTVERIGTRPAP